MYLNVTYKFIEKTQKKANGALSDKNQKNNRGGHSDRNYTGYTRWSANEALVWCLNLLQKRRRNFDKTLPTR